MMPAIRIRLKCCGFALVGWLSVRVTAGCRLTKAIVLIAAALSSIQTVRCGSTDTIDEFAELQRQIAARAGWNNERLEREAHQRDALVLDSDRSPLDIVWRRTQALLKHLQATPASPALAAEAEELAKLRRDIESAHSASEVEQRALFGRLTALRRRIAFQNPLLDFDAIVFLKHNKQFRGERHMVDQYLGFNAQKAGGVYVLRRPFSDAPQVRSLLAESPVKNGRLLGRNLENVGGFISLELDYDARSLLFAFTEAEHLIPAGASYGNQYCRADEIIRDKNAQHYYFRPESTYHVFRVNADGTDLRQLTDGMWNDFDPCFLPSGRIAFISERAGGQVRCGMRPLPSGTLHSMRADGSDLIQLSWHDTQEWHPSVDHQGMLVYTRWDYVDRDSDVAQHMWTCFPDGRDPRSPHGNYPERRELRPWVEMSIRAVPGSHRYVAVAAPHHGEAYGSIVLIDPRADDDRASAQLRRVTPEIPFPESESAPGVAHRKGTHSPRAEVFGTPWPLSEDFFLCVYDMGQRNYGIYLIDSFGNRELLYRDPQIACLDPIPLRPRPRPPVIAPATLQAAEDRGTNEMPAIGTVAILNVNESALPWPPGTRISAVRVVNIFPKDNPFMDDPNMGVAAQSLGRGVLGVAPVEADGSAHFTVPAGAPIYFQLLDQDGVAVQTMRSDTYVHPGETLTCTGCHEPRQKRATAQGAIPPMALRRAPSVLKREIEDAYPLTFPRLVQPVLDAHCVECHARESKAPGLRGDRFGKFGWSEAFHTLRNFAWGRSGGNGIAATERQYSLPGQEGARASRLLPLLDDGHYSVKLSPAERRRVTLWLDCNSNFYAAYTETDRQARGGIVAPRWGLPRWLPFEAMVHGEVAQLPSAAGNPISAPQSK